MNVTNQFRWQGLYSDLNHTRMCLPPRSAEIIIKVTYILKFHDFSVLKKGGRRHLHFLYLDCLTNNYMLIFVHRYVLLSLKNLHKYIRNIQSTWISNSAYWSRIEVVIVLNDSLITVRDDNFTYSHRAFTRNIYSYINVFRLLQSNIYTVV